jgi:hypothetical protein
MTLINADSKVNQFPATQFVSKDGKFLKFLDFSLQPGYEIASDQIENSVY